jgi:purine nucleoside permease
MAGAFGGVESNASTGRSRRFVTREFNAASLRRSAKASVRRVANVSTVKRSPADGIRAIVCAFALFCCAFALYRSAPAANAQPAPPASSAASLPGVRAAPLPIRVVVVTTFEPGADTGDVPGEFQFWVERLPLPSVVAFPQGYRSLRYDPARGILGIVTGEGAERGAASVMALGLDERFDLSHAYWVIAGIAGVDPKAASVGSAAWANWVVNADLGFEVDARDIPRTWPTGIVPFNRATPFAPPAPDADSIHGVNAYALNAGLASWAYALTASVPLADTANLRHIRARYARFPNARRPPYVLRGDSLCGDRYWVGPSMNAWAERWVPYWTGGNGTFVMTAEEDAGIMQALTFLAHAARVDVRRVMVLRTASDYTQPGDGGDAAGLLAGDASKNGESAYLEALEAAYRVGSTAVNELTAHWERYADHPPATP